MVGRAAQDGDQTGTGDVDRGGARVQERCLTGAPQDMEQSALKGTEPRPNAIVLAGEIEGAGGVMNAYTAKALT